MSASANLHSQEKLPSDQLQQQLADLSHHLFKGECHLISPNCSTLAACCYVAVVDNNVLLKSFVLQREATGGVSFKEMTFDHV